MERKAVFTVFLIGFLLVLALGVDSSDDCEGRKADGEICQGKLGVASPPGTYQGGRSCCNWNCVVPLPYANNQTGSAYTGVCMEMQKRWDKLSPEEQKQIQEKIKNKN